jgi:hypothetical protein
MAIENLAPQDQIWVYQADRKISPDEEAFFLKEMGLFFEEWQSHGEQLLGTAQVFDEVNLIVGVKQPQGKLCGGSADSLFRYVKSMGKNKGIDFFNRLKVATKNESGNIEIVPFFELSNYPERTMYNLAVKFNADLNNQFTIKVKDYLANMQ